MRSLPGTRRAWSRWLLIAAFAPLSFAAASEPGDERFALAAGHYARGRWQLAVDEFDGLIKEHPAHAQAARGVFFRGEALLQLGRHVQARRDFLAVQGLNVDESLKRQAAFRAGESAFLGGDDEVALSSLQDFTAAWPDDDLNAFAIAYQGEIALRQHKLAAAKLAFERCLATHPEGALQDDCRYGLARALEEQGDHEAAGRLYLALAAKRGSPLADDAQFRLAAQHYAAGDFAAALETLAAFDVEFAGSELRDRARLSRGWARLQQREYQEAETVFASLTVSESVGLEARYWLATCKQRQQSFAGAAKVFSQVADDSPNHELAPSCRFHAGDCWRLEANAVQAKSELDKCLAAWPLGEWADDCLLCQLKIAVDAQDAAEVDRVYAKLQATFAESDLQPEAKRLYVRSLMARKQFAAALESLREIAAPYDRYLKALCQQELGKQAEALKTIEPNLAIAREEAPELLVDSLQLHASLLISTGDHRSAQEPLARLLREHPDAVAAIGWQAQLAVCQAKIGDWEQSKATFRSLARSHPQDAVVIAAARQLGDLALAAGDSAWSGDLFGSVVEGQSSSDVAAQALSGLGWSRFRADDFAAADVAFSGALAKKPSETIAAEATFMHGACRQRMADDAAALTAYESCARDFPKSAHAPHACLALARLQSQRRDFAAAAEAYQRLIKDYSTYSERDAALYELAWTLRDDGRASARDAAFAQLKGECPQSRYWGDAAYRLAESARAEGRFDEARSLLNELAEAVPALSRQPHVLFLAGQVAAGRQQWPETASTMRQLIDERPESEYLPLAEFWLAEAEYRQGHHEAARKAFDQAAKRVDGRKDAWEATTLLRRAQLAALDRQWSTARELATRLSSDYPDFNLQYEADYVIGRCHASRGEFNEARAAYARVVSSPQAGRSETAAMAQWMTGESWFHQKKYAEALREYLKVEILYAYPQWQSAALLQAGKCCEQLGQWPQAADHYRRLIDEFGETEFVGEAKRREQEARNKSRSSAANAKPQNSPRR